MYFIAYIILGFCFLTFLYFGYRDDFNRNPRRFIGTVLGVLGSFLIVYFLESWKGVFLIVYNGIIYQFFFRNKNEKTRE